MTEYSGYIFCLTVQWTKVTPDTDGTCDLTSITVLVLWDRDTHLDVFSGWKSVSQWTTYVSVSSPKHPLTFCTGDLSVFDVNRFGLAPRSYRGPDPREDLTGTHSQSSDKESPRKRAQMLTSVWRKDYKCEKEIVLTVKVRLKRN